MSTPTITQIIAIPTVPHEVLYLLLYTDGDAETFERHTSPVLGMAMLDRDPSDGQLDYLVNEPDWQSPVTLSEFTDTCSNRYVVGVYPAGTVVEDDDLEDARESLRQQVRHHRERIAALRAGTAA